MVLFIWRPSSFFWLGRRFLLFTMSLFTPSAKLASGVSVASSGRARACEVPSCQAAQHTGKMRWKLTLDAAPWSVHVLCAALEQPESAHTTSQLMALGRICLHGSAQADSAQVAASWCQHPAVPRRISAARQGSFW